MKMPGHKTHKKFAFVIIGVLIVIGTLFYQFSLGYFGILEAFYCIIIIWLYSLLPDLDSRSAVIRNVVYYLLWSGVLITTITLILITTRENMAISKLIISATSQFSMLLVQLVISITGLTILMLKHRGIMHSYISAFILSIPLIFINPLFPSVAFTAYTSHLLLDDINKNE